MSESSPELRIYHVTPDREALRWVLHSEGVMDPLARMDSQGEAIDAARSLARAWPPGQAILHRADGTIEVRWTYGYRGDLEG